MIRPAEQHATQLVICSMQAFGEVFKPPTQEGAHVHKTNRVITHQQQKMRQHDCIEYGLLRNIFVVCLAWPVSVKVLAWLAVLVVPDALSFLCRHLQPHVKIPDYTQSLVNMCIQCCNVLHHSKL